MMIRTEILIHVHKEKDQQEGSAVGAHSNAYVLPKCLMPTLHIYIIGEDVQHATYPIV